jgi:hypothetical protein
MQYTALSTVRQRIQIGAPLPFNVRNADKTLLLACGQQVMSQAQLDALFEQGALVDIAELQSPRDQVRLAPRHELPRLWSQTMNNIGLALMNAPHHSFRSALDDATGPALSLIERDPDLAMRMRAAAPRVATLPAAVPRPAVPAANWWTRSSRYRSCCHPPCSSPPRTDHPCRAGARRAVRQGAGRSAELLRVRLVGWR